MRIAKDYNLRMKRITLQVGRRFGKLTVLNAEPAYKGNSFTKLLCDCGNSRVIRNSSLLAGETASCGCIFRSRDGRSTCPIYASWKGMIARCNKANGHRYFARYGGRGITVDPTWLDFDRFHSWAISAGWQKGLTLERTDNDGNYCPSNVVWADRRVQARNRSDTKLSASDIPDIREHLNKGQTLASIAALYGVTPSNIWCIKSGHTWVGV